MLCIFTKSMKFSLFQCEILTSLQCNDSFLVWWWWCLQMVHKWKLLPALEAWRDDSVHLEGWSCIIPLHKYVASLSGSTNLPLGVSRSMILCKSILHVCVKWLSFVCDWGFKLNMKMAGTIWSADNGRVKWMVPIISSKLVMRNNFFSGP